MVSLVGIKGILVPFCGAQIPLMPINRGFTHVRRGSRASHGEPKIFEKNKVRKQACKQTCT